MQAGSAGWRWPPNRAPRIVAFAVVLSLLAGYQAPADSAAEAPDPSAVGITRSPEPSDSGAIPSPAPSGVEAVPSPEPSDIGTARGASHAGDPAADDNDARCPYAVTHAPALPTGLRTADRLLADRLELTPHTLVSIPRDPDWSENPLHDNNWEFQFHSLRYTSELLRAWKVTGDQRYLNRARFLLRDWAADNPRDNPPSKFSWDKHATAWRAMAFACAGEFFAGERWWRNAARVHGQVLADPEFYVERGNHALNQDLGLLALGCVTRQRSWIKRATRRLARLAASSVDDEGVTNEQAIGYQVYNYERYQAAGAQLTSCGLDTPDAFDRVAAMPQMLAHATTPDGRYLPVGDTGHIQALAYDDPAARYAATKGAEGSPPADTHATYGAGFAFARTGWGEQRAFEDEAQLSLRFGPGRAIHGHDDGTSLTLHAAGGPLIVDPGKYGYTGDAMREWFVGPVAHNRVLLRSEFLSSEPTRLVRESHDNGLDVYQLRTAAWKGSTVVRTVAFSRAHGWVLVEDTVESPGSRTAEQLWHLPAGSRVDVAGDTTTVVTEQSRLQIQQLGANVTTTVVEGATDPLQGWVSSGYRSLVAAPTVSGSRHGRRLRWLTLLVPGELDVTVDDIARDTFGTRVRLTTGGDPPHDVRLPATPVRASSLDR